MDKVSSILDKLKRYGEVISGKDYKMSEDIYNIYKKDLIKAKLNYEGYGKIFPEMETNLLLAQKGHEIAGRETLKALQKRDFARAATGLGAFYTGLGVTSYMVNSGNNKKIENNKKKEK